MFDKKFYLKLLMSFLLVALSVPQLKAETKTVCDGTVQNDNVPTDCGNLDNANYGSQMIYTASVLSEQGITSGAVISSITFYANDIPAKTATSSFSLKVGETTSSTIADIDAYNANSATLTTVYTGVFPTEASTITINFSTPYNYGGKNLIIEFANEGGSYYTFSTKWFGVTAPIGSSMSKSYSVANAIIKGTQESFLPKMDITFEGATKRELSADKESLTFSTVAGTSVTNTVKVSGSNLTGNISAIISNDANGFFSVSPASLGTTGGELTITYNPTAAGSHTATLTLSSPGAEDVTIALTGTATGQSIEPSTDDNEVVKLVTVDKRSIYEPNFIDTANGNNTPQQLNCYNMYFRMAQPDAPAKQIKAGDLRPGKNLFEFYAIDDFGTEFRFATVNLYAEGQPSSNPSVNAMDAPIKVTPSVEYYTEDGMPMHPSFTRNTTLKYTEKTYNDVNELVDLDVIDVNDIWSANTTTNAHPDHYNFQIRGVGQYGDVLTSLTAEYVESHMTGYGNQLVMPEGWERGSFAGPNNEASDNVHTFYYYDLYIKKSFFDERGITGPVTVVINTTLSGSGFNADNYKAMSVNGVEQIIAKEEFKDYSWTVPLLDSIPTPSNVEHVPMGVIIRLVSTGADFNRTNGIYIYGGGTGVSNVDTVNIYKSSMNVKAYTQKQVDEDTDRSLVAMNAGAQTDVNVLAYGDPAVTGYDLYLNTSASTSGMTKVSTATHETDGSYTVSSQSESSYNGNYEYNRDESLGNIDGMWLNMYKAYAETYYLPVTVANGVGDDGVKRSENNTYGSAMEQVQKNGSVDFSSSKCYRSEYTWTKNGVTYAIYNPEVNLTSELPAATGYELYNYRLWVDYDEASPAWDFDESLQLTEKMDRPLYTGTDTHIGGQGEGGKDNWAFVAANDWNKVKLVARCYYKKTSGNHAPRKARPTDSDRLYYVVEKQVEVPMNQIVTGVNDVTGVKPVAGVKYYNLAGVESSEPFDGVNIVVTRYTDGSMSTSKVIK